MLAIEASAGHLTVPALLAMRREQLGSKVFARMGADVLTYEQIDRLANRRAWGFRDLGVGKGDIVCLMLANSLDFLGVWFGLSKLGAIEYPINFVLRGRLLRDVLKRTTCRVLVVDEACLDAVREVAADLDELDTIVVRRDDGSVRRIPADPIGPIRVVELESLDNYPDDAPEVPLCYSDVMAIMNTSGTTGHPKGVMLTHRHELVLAEEYLAHMRYGRDDVLYHCLPMFHNIGQAFCALPVLLAGASFVMTEKFSASRFWADLVAGGCTGFNFMGAMISILCKQPVRPEETMHRVRGAFGLPRPPGVSESFEARFGIALIEGYGQTEANIVSYLPWEDRRPGSSGKPIPRFQVEVVDDMDTPLPAGQVGEIVVRPRDPFTITTGYFGQPEETLAAFRNLWWHTGDFGKKDQDGFLYFVDRKKDVIRRRGENISSAMVEQAADTHSGVRECAAVGVESELSEHDVMLVVVPQEGCEPTAHELVAHCAQQLPPFAVPTYVLFLDQLPKTPNGKVRKQELRTQEMRQRAVVVSSSADKWKEEA